MKRHNRNRLTWAVAVTVAAMLAISPAAAEDAQPNPYAKADDSWIRIGGTVDDVRRDAFTLDYGDGIVTVEMDDGDRDADGYKLLEGDKVTVYGRIDDDLFESTTIEASSVYVENLETFFYASSVDEEDVTTFVTYWGPVEVSGVSVQGTVTDVDSGEFTLNTGTRSIRVDVDQMAYDPLDDEGYQKIEVGDRVSVAGTIDRDLFEGRELKARTIVTLVG